MPTVFVSHYRFQQLENISTSKKCICLCYKWVRNILYLIANAMHLNPEVDGRMPRMLRLTANGSLENICVYI